MRYPLRGRARMIAVSAGPIGPDDVADGGLQPDKAQACTKTGIMNVVFAFCSSSILQFLVNGSMWNASLRVVTSNYPAATGK